MIDAAEELRCFRHVGGMDASDTDCLSNLAELITPALPKLTNDFYDQLINDPLTEPHVRGRVEALKQTHQGWLESLFCGDYGEAFMERQRHIGRVHVLAGIPPLFVAASMSFLRAQFPRLVAEHCAGDDRLDCSTCLASLLRLLDLCQYLIDRAYEEHRLDLLSQATGMSRKLIENLVMLNKG